MYFFASTVYFASNPLSEFRDIHLNIGSVGREHDVCQELFKL